MVKKAKIQSKAKPKEGRKNWEDVNIQELMILPDEVIINAEDFGFKTYAKTLVTLITNGEVKTPLTIAIHGAWGSGKSSLLRTIEQVITNDKTFNKYFDEGERFVIKKSKIIWFNAWEYEHEENLSVVLLQYIANELKGDKKENNFPRLQEFVKIVGKIAVDYALNKVAGTSIKEIKKHMTKYGVKIKDIAKLQDLFEDTLTEFFDYYKNNKKDKIGYEQIIIFIDDLDRCCIENSKHIIDTIRLFLSTEKCIFILGVDIDKLQTSLDFIYGKNVKFDAREYLEKFIQLRFDLPPLFIEDVKDFIKKNLPEAFITEYIDVIAEGIKKNPRNIKLFINNMKLQLMLSKYQDFEVNIPLLVEWVVIRHSFPEFAKEVENNPPILLKYHDEKIIEKYKAFENKEKQIEFISTEGMKEEFIKNEKLNKFLKANKQKFDSSDVRKVILQTQLTPSIITDSLDKKSIKLKEDFETNFYKPILEIKNEMDYWISQGKHVGKLKPIIRFFESYIEKINLTLVSINNSENVNEVYELIEEFKIIEYKECSRIFKYLKSLGSTIIEFEIDELMFNKITSLLSTLISRLSKSRLTPLEEAY